MDQIIVASILNVFVYSKFLCKILTMFACIMKNFNNINYIIHLLNNIHFFKCKKIDKL